PCCLPRNGEQLGVICEDSKYDFTLQEIREVKEILIIISSQFSPGDAARGRQDGEILVECNFQTLDRSGITFVSLFFYLEIFRCF
ncbi:MOXD2 protein, partial [Oreotrochilus melanogaster]|nr:MOXD2 protein [Oreotrochilus melanogaster]